MNPPRPGLAFALLLALAACGEREGQAGGGADSDRLAALRQFEASRRAATDFSRLPASDQAMGPNPIALRPVAPGGAVPAPGAPAFLSPLRGRDALVLLDASLRELARAPAPASPTGVAVTANGEVYVSGEASPAIVRYAVRGAALEPAGRIELDGLRGVRDLAAGPEGVLYALDERAGALITLRPGPPGADGRIPAARADTPIGAGPFRVERLAHHLLVDSLLDHTLTVLRVGDAGEPLADGAARIRHDGPIWSFAALETGTGEVLVAAGGVEDHPLDRSGGSFGYIDSFVFLYRVTTSGAPAGVARLAAVNVSALGVITPKALALSIGPGGDGVRVTVTGYGGALRAELRFPGARPSFSSAPEVVTRPLPPGTAAMVAIGPGAFAYANPLLDAWLVEQGDAVAKVAVRDDGAADGRSLDARDTRLGEALFFTSLMAPWNTSDGALSRFTCETCHFEGYVDGRTHHTGRGDVHATTKPLLGLFNNRPHFSRALDPDLSSVAHNEFRVAGSLSGHDPWFALTPKDAPWLAELGAGAGDGEPTGGDGAGELDPVSLRRALMSFLMAFSHRANPAVVGRAGFTAPERAGAGVFRDRCASCHAPVLASDEPASAVPFDRWEGLVFTPEGPIVWGRVGYEKTGILPYVHEQGARVPSLRRLYKKQPYFTNGSAKTLREVLLRARFGQDTFFHDGAPAGLTALTPDEVDSLSAFLDLL